METEQRKARRDAGKEKFWRETMEEAAGTGMSIREFCRQRELNENQFYSWRRELKLRDVEKEMPEGFVELVAARGPSGESSGVSIRVGDRIRITVERGFDGRTLNAVLAAVSQDGK